MSEQAAPLLTLMERRHSCRAFTHRPVPRETIAQMLSMAQHTASWCNAQPWRVHVVSGEPLERLKREMMAVAESGEPPSPELEWPREYRGVYLERRRECGWALYKAVGVAMGDRAASSRQANENFRMFGAPHLLVLSTDEALGIFGAIDCGGWLTSFMLSATSVGVATVPQAAVGGLPTVLRRHLNIASDRRIVCGVSFGYEDFDHPANGFRTTRAALPEVVEWVD